MKILSRFLLIIAALGASPAALLPAHAQTCESPTVIRYAMVPLREIELDLRRRESLFKRMTELTGRPVEVVRATSYRSVVEGLLRGAVDVAELGPATYIEATEGDRQITAFATTERSEGVYQLRGAHYQSMLVVLAKIDFSDIDTLKGTRLALTDPGSTSGAMLPRKQFVGRVGMPLENYFGAVSYSGSHARSVQALVSGAVDAAFVASAQLEEAHLAGKLRKNDVRVLWTSGPIPNDPTVYRGQLCEPLKRRITEVFLGEGAGMVLRDYMAAMNAERFVAVDDSLYAGIREVLEAPPPTGR